MTLTELNELMGELALTRPIFHSEADFQHAFAWRIHERLPDARIRLEYSPYWMEDRIHLDVWVESGPERLAFELKYKTRQLVSLFDGEVFNLVDQSAAPIGRYDFLKDVQRLEAVSGRRSKTHGYVVMLTNNSIYWNPPRSQNIDAAFRLDGERVLTGELAWSPLAGDGTTKDRTDAIRLSGEYVCSWHDFSQVESELGRSNRFRYLAVEI